LENLERNFSTSTPPILYKYRDWDNEFHKRIITNQEIYFSSADQLNDPYDCALPLRMNREQLTRENIVLKCSQLISSEHPEWDDSKVQMEANKEADAGRMFDEAHLKSVEKDGQKKLNEFLGIFCVSSLYDNFLMWYN